MVSTRDLRSSSAAINLARPPSRPEPSTFGDRPPGVDQPSQAVDSLGSQEMEILESSSTLRISLSASLELHRNDGDNG